MSDFGKRLWRLTKVALVLALVGATLGSAVMLIGLWKLSDEVMPTTVQAAASSPRADY